jgi:outer membrane receptor protein involved in Fe transport
MHRQALLRLRGRADGWRAARPPARAVTLAVSIFVLSVFAAAPGGAARLQARLLLPEGQPASGYMVSVVGQAVTVPCDADGRFLLDPAPRPPFAIIASGPNGEVSAPFEITTVETLTEITLPPIARDSVTVVSGVAPTLDTLPASAATVVTLEELEQRAPQRLFQVLESVAGASKLGDGADSVPALRGLARGRTLILLDGARVSAERRAGPSATFVDPESLASVEVLRGPGSVIYGSDAFGGVINAVTRDPDPGALGLRFGVEASAGALDQQAAYLAGSADLGSGQLLAEGHWRSADDAEAGEGAPIFNSGFDSRGGALRYLHDLGPGRLRVGVALDRMEDLGKAAIDSRQIKAIYPEESSDRLVASWIGTPGGEWESLESSLFFGRYHVVLDRDRVPTATSNRRIDRADTDARDASFRLLGARSLAGGRLQLGADAWSRFSLHAITGRVDFAADATTVAGRTELVSVDDARQLTTGLFGTWSRPLGATTSLGIGVRGDRVESRNEGGFFGDRAQSHAALSGNVALTWTPSSHWSHTAQIARGFRSPTLSDRYFRGPSGRGFVTGNPDLDPETALQLDLASRWTRGRTALGIYAYRYEIEDLIERFGAGNDFLFRNRGKATIEGVELEVQTPLAASWTIEAGAAYADGATDGGAEIDDIAAPNGWTTLRWAFDRGYVFGRVTTFLSHDEPGPTELARPGFTVFDLGGGWRFTEAIELRLAVRNAGDELYTAAADDAADRAVGRSVTLAVSGRL